MNTCQIENIGHVSTDLVNNFVLTWVDNSDFGPLNVDVGGCATARKRTKHMLDLINYWKR